MITKFDLLVIALSLVLITGYIGSFADYIVEKGDEEMTEITFQAIDDWTSDEWLEEFMRTNVEHVIRGEFTPAATDIDFQTIERFVFYHNIDRGRGHTFILDKMYDNVYYSPSVGGATNLNSRALLSASFKEDDLNRLIQVIEEADIRNWEEFYEGEINRVTVIFDEEDDIVLPVGNWMLGAAGEWAIGIQFSDGTMLRRSGSGTTISYDFFPPQDQWVILISFIVEMGEEIQERHRAEATQS